MCGYRYNRSVMITRTRDADWPWSFVPRGNSSANPHPLFCFFMKNPVHMEKNAQAALNEQNFKICTACVKFAYAPPAWHVHQRKMGHGILKIFKMGSEDKEEGTLWFLFYDKSNRFFKKNSKPLFSIHWHFKSLWFYSEISDLVSSQANRPPTQID